MSRNESGFTTDLSPWFDVARLASPAPPQLQALLFWAGHFSDRYLDDAVGHNLARLSTDPLGAATGHRDLRRTDCFVRSGASCRRMGRAPQSPQAACVDTG